MSLLHAQHQEHIGDEELIWVYLCFLLRKDKFTKGQYEHPRIIADYKVSRKPSGFNEIISCAFNELTEFTLLPKRSIAYEERSYDGIFLKVNHIYLIFMKSLN